MMKCPVCGAQMDNPVEHAKKHLAGKKGGRKTEKKK
jgi:hypothetical protein